MTDLDLLLAQVAERARQDELEVPPPVTPDELRQAEARLGFALHPVLAELYLRLGDGGFGPEYYFLPLWRENTESLVSGYLAKRTGHAGTEWAWPEGVVPILTWGCGMYAAVDCRSDEGTVLWFEPNPGDPEAAWFVDTPSLLGWLEHLVEDTGWWVLLENGEDPGELRPWEPIGERRRQ